MDSTDRIIAQCAMNFTNFCEIYEILIGIACARTGAGDIAELERWASGAARGLTAADCAMRRAVQDLLLCGAAQRAPMASGVRAADSLISALRILVSL